MRLRKPRSIVFLVSLLMNGGDSFFLYAPEVHNTSHLWVVLSDPERDPENVLVVNITTWKHDHDDACILERGDHPFVIRRTCVNYGAARTLKLEQITEQAAKGGIKLQEPFNPEVLQRMRTGATRSEHLALKHRQLLLNQDLVDIP